MPEPDMLARHLAALAAQGWPPEALAREEKLLRAAAAQHQTLAALTAAFRI